MKQVVVTGNGKTPLVKITVVESSAKNTISLSIEFMLSAAHSRRARHKAKRKSRRHLKNDSHYAARPVIGYMNIFGKIELGKRVYVHMIHNSDFPDPYPPLWLLGNVTEDLDDAYYEAIHGGEKERNILGEKEKAFDVYFLELVKYVDRMAKGSADIYKSAGMEPMVVYSKSRKSG